MGEDKVNIEGESLSTLKRAVPEWKREAIILTEIREEITEIKMTQEERGAIEGKRKENKEEKIEENTRGDIKEKINDKSLEKTGKIEKIEGSREMEKEGDMMKEDSLQ